MYKVLHHIDDVSRKEGRRGHPGIQDCVDASIQKLEKYIKKFTERLITATINNIPNTKHQSNENNQKTKMRRKTNVWTFQATNQWNLTLKNLDMTKKEKTLREKLNLFS